MVYAGAKKMVSPSKILEFQKRGWWAQEKLDGIYCTISIGAAPGWRQRRELGRVSLVQKRSGKFVGTATGRDVLGLQTGWPPGTVVVGELMVQTPAAHRWQDAHGVRGFVAFDVLRLGDWNLFNSSRDGCVPFRDLRSSAFADRHHELQRLVETLPTRKARRAIKLAPVHRTKLRALYTDTVAAGGEGIVLIRPGAVVGERNAKRKVKRRDTVTCSVLRVLADERKALISHGGMAPFAISLPRFAVRVGDLVDVHATGFYGDSWIPRHARAVRARPDLA